MKKLFTIFFTAAGLLGSLTTQAQKTDTLKTRNWFRHDIAGATQIQVMYRKTNLDQLNRVLNNNGLPSLGNNNIWINASMSHAFKKFIWEDGIGFTPVSSSEVNGLKTRFNQYQAFLRFGYDISNSSGFKLFPFAGVNLNASVLNIQDKNRERNTSDFSQEILNSTSSKTLYQPNFGIDLGVGFDHLIQLKDKQIDNVRIQRSIPIGVRLGYYINAAQGDWKLNDYSLNNGPNNKNSAFFATFNIGLGYRITRR